MKLIGKEQFLGIVRHSLTFIGGFLVTKGLIDETLVLEMSGAIITLAGGIWSVIEKNKK